MAEDAPTKELKRKFLSHLRNPPKILNEHEQIMKDQFNLKMVYPEKLFYKTHKIT